MHFLRVAREALTERRDPNHDRTTRHDALPHAHLAEEIPIDPRIMHGRQGTSTHWPEQCKSSAWGHHAARSEISLSPKKGRAFGHTHVARAAARAARVPLPMPALDSAYSLRARKGCQLRLCVMDGREQSDAAKAKYR